MTKSSAAGTTGCVDINRLRQWRWRNGWTIAYSLGPLYIKGYYIPIKNRQTVSWDSSCALFPPAFRRCTVFLCTRCLFLRVFSWQLHPQLLRWIMKNWQVQFIVRRWVLVWLIYIWNIYLKIWLNMTIYFYRNLQITHCPSMLLYIQYTEVNPIGRKDETTRDTSWFSKCCELRSRGWRNETNNWTFRHYQGSRVN